MLLFTSTHNVNDIHYEDDDDNNRSIMKVLSTKNNSSNEKICISYFNIATFMNNSINIAIERNIIYLPRSTIVFRKNNEK